MGFPPSSYPSWCYSASSVASPVACSATAMMPGASRPNKRSHSTAGLDDAVSIKRQCTTTQPPTASFGGCAPARDAFGAFGSSPHCQPLDNQYQYSTSPSQLHPNNSDAVASEQLHRQQAEQQPFLTQYNRRDSVPWRNQTNYSDSLIGPLSSPTASSSTSPSNYSAFSAPFSSTSGVLIEDHVSSPPSIALSFYRSPSTPTMPHGVRCLGQSSAIVPYTGGSSSNNNNNNTMPLLNWRPLRPPLFQSSVEVIEDDDEATADGAATATVERIATPMPQSLAEQEVDQMDI
jgi:hypothetical protein